MQFDLDSALQILRRTPRTLDAGLRDLPDNWARATEGPDTGSAYDVVGPHPRRRDGLDSPRARPLGHEPEKRVRKSGYRPWAELLERTFAVDVAQGLLVYLSVSEDPSKSWMAIC